MADALVDRTEGAPVEEVGGVHRVAGAPQIVREGVEARGLTLSMVEEQYLCHLASVCGLGRLCPTKRWSVPSVGRS
jgi:hypothetical protein